MRSDDEAMVERPVPPPAAVRRPASVFVKVMTFADAVMVVEAVRPLNADDEVAKVMVLPVCVCPAGPSAVMPASVPHEKTPVDELFTSQFAAFSAETVRFVVDAVSKYPVPETESAVDEA
jgi:hypothetical protein